MTAFYFFVGGVCLGWLIGAAWGRDRLDRRQS